MPHEIKSAYKELVMKLPILAMLSKTKTANSHLDVKQWAVSNVVDDGSFIYKVYTVKYLLTD
jgi:hypothetical protein